MKKKLLKIFTASTLILASTPLIQAQTCGAPAPCGPPCAPCYYDPCACNWYLAASGSVAWHNNLKFVNNELGISANAKYKTGWGAAVSLGYIFDLCNCWDFRLEAEFVYRRNKLKNFNVVIDEETINIPFNNGHIEDRAIMANLLLDIPLFCDLGAYVGGGIGVTFNKRKGNITGIDPATDEPFSITVSSNKTLFAWQLLAGLSYCICPNITFTTGYRLFATSKAKGGRDFDVKSSHIPLTHSVDFGLRFRF